MGLMSISGIVVLVVIGVLIWWLVGKPRNLRALPESPEEVLKRRYARGEINKEEYERMLSDLRR
jgi:putative membrane protein